MRKAGRDSRVARPFLLLVLGAFTEELGQFLTVGMRVRQPKWWWKGGVA